MEAYQRIGAGGMDLPSAVLRVNESIGLAVEPPPGVQAMESQPSAIDNDKALAELTQLLGGVA